MTSPGRTTAAATVFTAPPSFGGIGGVVQPTVAVPINDTNIRYKKIYMDVSAQIIKEMSAIVDNDSIMNRLLAYVKKLAKSVHEKKQQEDITMHIANGLRQTTSAAFA